MVKKITGNIKFSCKKPIEIIRSDAEKENIIKNWNDFIKNHVEDGIYNGKIYAVIDLIREKNKTILVIAQTNFADYIYAKMTKKICVHTLFVASYIITKDGYYGIIVNKEKILNTIGGMVEEVDFLEGKFCPEICLQRELKEEIGIDLYDKNYICKYSAKYAKYPAPEQKDIPIYSVGILYQLETCKTTTELIDIYNKRRINTDKEVDTFFFFNKNSLDELIRYENKEDYILELFDNILRQGE